MLQLRVSKLAKALLADELTEKDKIKYYLAAIYLQLIAAGVPAYFWGFKLDNVGVFSYLIGAVVATLCVFTIKNVNDGIDGKYIIERLAILTFPAFLQSIIAYWIMYFGITVVYLLTKLEIGFYLFGLIGLPFYYWYGFELIRKALNRHCV